jgi:hypothetical protein
VHPIRECRGNGLGNLEREPRLADAAWTRESHLAYSGALQQARHCIQLFRASDKGSEWYGKSREVWSYRFGCGYYYRLIDEVDEIGLGIYIRDAGG